MNRAGLPKPAAPADTSELRLFHRHTRRFFLILAGQPVIECADGQVPLTAGQGLKIPPGLIHRFCNESETDGDFLVIFAPGAHGARVSDDAAPEEAGP